MNSVLKKILKTLLIILVTVAILFFAFLAWFIYEYDFYESDFKKTVIFSETYSGEPYELVVSEVGSAFIFGPSDVEIELKRKGETIYKKKTGVGNDGKALSKEMNFKTEWSDEKLIVTVMGEEQNDEIIEIELKKQ